MDAMKRNKAIKQAMIEEETSPYENNSEAPKMKSMPISL